MSDDEIEVTEEETPFLERRNDSTPFERLRELRGRLSQALERLNQARERMETRIVESESKTPSSLSDRIFLFLAVGALVLTFVNEFRTDNDVLINFFGVYALLSLVFDRWVFPKVKLFNWALRARMIQLSRSPLELRYEPLSCTVRWFGFSPNWNRYTRFIENESDPEMVAFWSRVRSDNLSAIDILFLMWRFLVVVLSAGLVYSSICSKGVSRNVWTVASFVLLCSFEHIQAVVEFLILSVRRVKLKRAYNELDLDEL